MVRIDEDMYTARQKRKKLIIKILSEDFLLSDEIKTGYNEWNWRYNIYKKPNGFLWYLKTIFYKTGYLGYFYCPDSHTYNSVNLCGNPDVFMDVALKLEKEGYDVSILK